MLAERPARWPTQEEAVLSGFGSSAGGARKPGFENRPQRGKRRGRARSSPGDDVIWPEEHEFAGAKEANLAELVGVEAEGAGWDCQWGRFAGGE